MNSNTVPYWQDDPDYFPPKDERRPEHIAEIKRRRRITGMIDACVSDGSYSVLVSRDLR